ncbi:MAG: 7-carboxy-7-deazaguanine synthase QueE [Candidatus Omnitrophota bacterium]|nr:MAG: 7-carboxy-7-deazaguanine synthase QueE [Candidatus Omnitrophota bacterium]
MQAKISEIFKSVQGEGIYQGIPQVFVRFFGCNLECAFCDTPLDSFKEMNIQEVSEQIYSYEDYHSITFTGGEPLLQVDFLTELTKELKIKGKELHLETNGTLHENLEKVIEYLDVIAMDFKLPSSTNSKAYWNEHGQFLRIARQRKVFIKAVIGKDTDIYDIHKSVILIKRFDPTLNLILQPQNPFERELEEKMCLFKQICRNANINARIIPQAHKVLGVK